MILIEIAADIIDFKACTALAGADAGRAAKARMKMAASVALYFMAENPFSAEPKNQKPKILKNGGAEHEKAFLPPIQPSLLWYPCSWRDLHRRVNADSV